LRFITDRAFHIFRSRKRAVRFVARATGEKRTLLVLSAVLEKLHVLHILVARERAVVRVIASDPVALRRPSG
jgi:hypothetical protein